MNVNLYILFRYLLLLSVGAQTAKLQNESLIKTNFTYAPICVRDAQVPLSFLSNPDNYAFATFPVDTVYIAPSSLPKAGLGVFATRFIPQDTYFGPYLGYKHNDSIAVMNSTYAWSVEDYSGTIEYYIDGIYLRNSNWLRFVNCPNTVSQENILAFIYDGEIMYKAIRNINVGEELLVYYGNSYAELLGIDSSQFSSCRFLETCN